MYSIFAEIKRRLALTIYLLVGKTSGRQNLDANERTRGHDAWVVGDEPVKVIDWFGASDYAKNS
jgi:hypothetical protein